jgi:hypothetical protein
MTFDLNEEDLDVIHIMFAVYEMHKKRTIKMIKTNRSWKVTADLALEKHDNELDRARDFINKILEQY